MEISIQKIIKIQILIKNVIAFEVQKIGDGIKIYQVIFGRHEKEISFILKGMEASLKIQEKLVDLLLGNFH